MTKNKDENNALKSKKELFLANLHQRQQEAKLVRRIVAIVAFVLIIIVAIVGTSGYFYIKSALQPVNPESEQEIIIDI
ncbi:endolytic transglycosylase MltG, partial [Pseudomonas sp. SWRI111]